MIDAGVQDACAAQSMPQKIIIFRAVELLPSKQLIGEIGKGVKAQRTFFVIE